MRSRQVKFGRPRLDQVAHGPGREPLDFRTASVFCKEGEYWTIAYQGTVFRLRDAKGLRYVAQLLGRPGERVPAVALLPAAASATEDGPTNAERARFAVTKRIKAAIQKIGEHHAALGYHLATTIKTGRQCTYLPDPQRPLEWLL